MTTLARPPRRKPMFSSTPRAVLTAGLIAMLVATGGEAVATAQPSTTPAAPTSSAPAALQQQAPAPADPCATTTTTPTTTTTTAVPQSITTSAAPTSCAEAPSPAPSTQQATVTGSETQSIADAPAPAPSATATPSLTPSVQATAPTPTGARIPYTGLPTENPNSTIVPGKMRSDREDWPDPFTKEEADQAEIGEAKLLAKQRTSRAAVTCQRYWPSNFDVCGAIRDKYNSLGGSFSFLLLPTSGNIVNPGGTGERVTFLNGPIYWSAAGGAHPVVNSFLNRWGILGYEGSYLKYPTTDEIVLPDGGRRQEFQDGAIYVAFQNAIGSAIQNGPLRDKYNSVGGLTPGSSALGYLTGDHNRALPDGQGQMARFQNGVIYWSPSTGAHPVSGQILETWSAAGYETGEYGYPTGDAGPGDRPGSILQQFQNSSITYYGGLEVPVSGGDEEVVFTRNNRGGNFVDDYGNLFARVVFPDEIAPPYAEDSYPMDWNFVNSPVVQSLAAPNTMGCTADLFRGGRSVYHYSDLNKFVSYTFHSRIPKQPLNVRQTLSGKCKFRLSTGNGSGTVTFKLVYRVLDPDL